MKLIPFSVERLVGKYFPWGQERPSATQDGKEKFATYFRDSETGLDYANNRYHQPGMGRFMAPDRTNGSLRDPGSLNKYAYASGDPINGYDPSGRDTCYVNGDPTPCQWEPADGALPDPASISETCYMLWPLWMNDPATYAQFCGGGTGFGGDPGGGDPGGGGGGNGITPQERLEGALKDEVTGALNHSDCAQIFGTAPDYIGHNDSAGPPDVPTPGELLGNLINGGKYGSIGFGDALGNPAMTKPVGSANADGFYSKAYIEINLLAFGPDTWNASGHQQGILLLHELGHVLRYFGWKGGDFYQGDEYAAGVNNNSIIDTACGKYLE